MSEKRPIDWESVEKEYRAGIRTLRDIADEHGCSHVAIQKRANKDGWTRDLSAKNTGRVVLEPDQFGRAGFVYVIYLDDTAGERFYKIGMASAFTPRFQAHQCASPFDVCVACAYFVGDMRAEERYLHGAYAGQKVRGEWFKLSSADMDAIASRARLV